MAASLASIVARAQNDGLTELDVEEAIHAMSRWLEWQRPKIERDLDEILSRLEARRAGELISDHARHRALRSLAGTMRNRGLTAAEILPTLIAVNKSRCVPPLHDRDVAGIARAVAERPAARPLTQELRRAA